MSKKIEYENIEIVHDGISKGNIIKKDKNKKFNNWFNKNKKLILIIGGILVIIILGIVIFFNTRPSNSNKVDFKEKVKVYEKINIAYTVDDYNKDTLAKETGSEYSAPTLSLTEKNDKLLQDTKDSSLIDIKTEELSKSLNTQIVDFNKTINTHVGLSDEEYPEEDYNLAKGYIDLAIESMQGDVSPPNQFYEGEAIDQMYAHLRYCISENDNYTMLMESPEYYDILSNYMKIGHPAIDTSTITIESSPDNKVFDDLYMSNLQATVTSDGKTYLIQLASIVYDENEGNNIYKILDIEEI